VSSDKLDSVHQVFQADIEAMPAIQADVEGMMMGGLENTNSSLHQATLVQSTLAKPLHLRSCPSTINQFQQQTILNKTGFSSFYDVSVPYNCTLYVDLHDSFPGNPILTTVHKVLLPQPICFIHRDLERREVEVSNNSGSLNSHWFEVEVSM
jgi:hypothetical protein